MADERRTGEGFEPIRLVINLAALALFAGTIALIIAAIVVET